MSTFIVELFCKALSFIFISIFSLTSSLFEMNTNFAINDNNRSKSVNVSAEIIEHKTVTKYNKSLPQGEKKVITDGVDGITYNYDEQKIKISDPITKVIEVGTGAKGDYSGTLTAYGPDCDGCTGILACKTREGKYLNLYDGIYYDDKEYGTIRILATDHTLFPCGTIIEITNSSLKQEVGIVLDTGSQMRKAWRQDGIVWIDLATEKNDHNALKFTNHNTNYKVKRWGW